MVDDKQAQALVPSTRPSPKSGAASGTSGRRPGPLIRAIGGLAKFGERVGFLSSSDMSRFSDVFLGSEPWFSPGLPLQPKRADGEPPKKFQFQPGYNIAMQPRSTEEITFSQLRALGDYTLVRVIIEHIKKLIKGHEWDIVPEDRSSAMVYQEEISFVKTFLEKPDKRSSWDEWVGQVLEDRFVLDAASIYKHRDMAGRLWALEVVDGASIKPLSDERGFEPVATVGYEEVPAYQQFQFGVPYCNLNRSDFMYRPYNRRSHKFYGFGEVEQMVIIANMGIRREIYNLAMFSDTNIPKGLAGVPEDWGPEDIKGFEQWFNSTLSGNPQDQVKIKFLPKGFDLTKWHDEEIFGLFNKWDEWLARISCFTFGISPMAFIQLTNRAVAQEMGDVEAEGGVGAAKLFIERIVNEIVRDEFQMPHLRFNWITDRSRMTEKRVHRNVEYKKAGIFTANEIREEEGLDPRPDGEGLTMQAAGAGGGAGGGFGGFGGGVESGGVAPYESTPYELALMRCQVQELDKWERFATTRIGKPAAGKFSCDFLPDAEASEIRAEIEKADTAERLQFIFDSRRRKRQPVRLAPPAARDAAHHSGDLARALRQVLEPEASRIAGKAASQESDVRKGDRVSMTLPMIRLEPTINIQPAEIKFSPQIHLAAAPAPNVQIENLIKVEKPEPTVVNIAVEKQDVPKVEVHNVVPPAPAPVVKAFEPTRPPRKRTKFIVKRDQYGNMDEIVEVDA
jgi:hypothetical protein